MKRTLVGLAVLIIVLAIAFALSFHFALFSGSSPSPSADAAPASASSSTPYIPPPLTQSYSNSTYHFALKLPADFTVQETQNQGATAGETMVLQNKAGDGIQIVISPWDEDTSGSYTLTADRIRQDLPDLTITDAQPVVVGPNYTGLAFRSDNQAFNGDSREVWFVFDHHLYQISTYARLDPLLKAIFATWNFD